MTITKQGAWMFFGLVIFWLGQHHALAQGLCDKNNWPANAVEGDFKIEGDISVGCSPLTVKLKNLSAGTDIRYDFYYDGKAANALDKVGNKDSVNAYFSNNGTQGYRILQYGKKNGQDMYACKTIGVRSNNEPIFSYNSCNNNSVEINIPNLPENNFDFYEISWGDGSTSPEKIFKSDLPYSKTKSLTLPRTIKVEGFFTSNILNCSSPSSIVIPFKIPTLFPNGYDDPNKVNIDKIELINGNKAILTFHGSFDTKGYELFKKEQGKPYQSLGTQFTPGSLSINLEDSTKSYCFYLDRQISCGSDPSAELCTLPLYSVEFDEKIDVLKWSDYPNTITAFDSRTFGRYLDKKQTLTIKEDNNTSAIVIDNSRTGYSIANQNCKKKICYRISIETSGQLYYYKYAGKSISNEICADRQTFNPPALNDLMVSVNNDNLNELTFTDNSNWNLGKEMYYLFAINNSETIPIDSTLASSIIDNKSKPDLQSECYQIRYKDECGSLSQPSPQVCNINLTAQMDDELNWTHKSPFGMGNLAAYEILETDENTNIEKVLTSLDPSIKKSKTDLKDFEVEAKYRIKGISSGGKESFSNMVKIPIEALFFVPDVFTPNGDPENGTWQIKGRFGRVQDYKLQIFDRWGTQLLEIDDFKINWDGTYQQQALPVGTYLYKLSIGLTGNENFIKQGKFELLR